MKLTSKINPERLIMKTEFKNSQIRKVCTDASAAEKKYGLRMAEKIQLRIDQIHAASSIEEMIQFRIGRCHPLHQNRKSKYALDLVHPMRLILEKKGSEIEVVMIIEIEDYH